MSKKIIVAAVFLFFFFAPLAQAFEVSGWIPYWNKTDGSADAIKHISLLTEINPFGYSVRSDGTLNDLAGIKKSPWTSLFRKAKSNNVQIIPSIMWSDGDAMQTILSDQDTRTKHIKAVVSMVKNGRYDGVDIDYENKKSTTKDSFSAFLKELKTTLGSKILSCTIEPRTPANSLYTNIPTDLAYANDYNVIAQYCDKVKIMAYDQGRADLVLAAAKKGMPYAPVADIDWVKKVLALVLQTIPKEKVMLGIPTYGREWQIGVIPQQYKDYSAVRSINPKDAVQLADDLDITPVRNQAGELSFSYVPKGIQDPISNLIRDNTRFAIPANTADANVVAARALLYTTASKKPSRFNLVWWSDAQAVQQKVDLAKQMGLDGVALFKIDGEEDPGIWDVLK